MTYYIDSKGQVTLIKRPSTHQKARTRNTTVTIKSRPKLKPV